ncbi:putative methyltransferase transcription factor C2H2 family [Rosa chinensis]|uniref:Putative methyltransferase transcription factor C2H2 family n=1 Tax=Rosa chinensis TaxID=74649 RepID=A0A2P6SAB4_ROSCH|nr:putative methyltransferase transcription factor C2H2 family [Rosa chinensis]
MQVFTVWIFLIKTCRVCEGFKPFLTFYLSPLSLSLSLSLKSVMANRTEYDPTLTDDEDEVEELQDWDDWNAEEEEEEESSDLDSDFLCFFCHSRFSSCDELFDHCSATHHFDFPAIRKALGLLTTFALSNVADNRCWSCGLSCQSNKDLQSHLHETVNLKDIKPMWNSDEYLKPFLQDDSVLFSFGEDEEGDDDYTVAVDKDELMSDLRHFEEICIDHQIHVEKIAGDSDNSCESGKRVVDSSSNGYLNTASSSGNVTANGVNSVEHVVSADRKTKGKSIKAYIPNHVSKDMKNINDNYFASYSSYGIHREMLSDKNGCLWTVYFKESLPLEERIVMDVGCGTGILSLFAAQAGASRVIAVEASEKMASVATLIAKDNGLLWKSPVGSTANGTGVIEVVQGMVEELDKSMVIQPHSVDVLLSEWMGYCLLYEAMLSSVLFDGISG